MVLLTDQKPPGRTGVVGNESEAHRASEQRLGQWPPSVALALDGGFNQFWCYLVPPFSRTNDTLAFTRKADTLSFSTIAWNSLI